MIVSLTMIWRNRKGPKPWVGEAIASLAFLDTVAALPAPLEEEYESEVNPIMVMKENLDVLTYRERKAFRQGRQEALRESARRMAEAGMAPEAIAALLKVSEAELAAWLGDTPREARG